MILHYNVVIKCNLVNERSAFLWHKHLGHVSIERMEGLIKNDCRSV